MILLKFLLSSFLSRNIVHPIISSAIKPPISLFLLLSPIEFVEDFTSSFLCLSLSFFD